MIITDAEGEQWIAESRFDIAVPVHVEQNGAETKIFAYPSVSAVCETYAYRFSDDLFSDAAIDFLLCGLYGIWRTVWVCAGQICKKKRV